MIGDFIEKMYFPFKHKFKYFKIFDQINDIWFMKPFYLPFYLFNKDDKIE